MKFNIKQIKGLLAARNNHYQQAIDKLIAGQAADAKKHIESFKTASEIIDVYKASRLFFVAIAVGIICILFVVIMFTTTVNSADVTLDIQCTELMFRTTEDWENGSEIEGNSIYINRLTSVSRNWGPDINTSQLDIKGTTIILKELKFDSSGVVWIRLSSGQLKFTGQNTVFGGKISLRSGEISATDTNYSINQPADIPPSTFKFDSEYPLNPDHRVELNVTGASQWKLEGIKTDSLKFEENYPPGSGNFRSTILNGDIKLEDTGINYEISEGQRLLVRIVNTDKFYLTEENSSLRFRFRGNVSTLEGYYKGDKKDFMPTWLEHIYKNERLIFIWSAILFIIGTIWSIRNVLFK